MANICAHPYLVWGISSSKGHCWAEGMLVGKFLILLSVILQNVWPIGVFKVIFQLLTKTVFAFL